MASNERARILVIEDDYQVAEMLLRQLSEAGYEVAHAADGNRGLELAKSDRYDLVILDLILPGKGGTDICKDLRKNGCASRILMLTSRSEEFDKVLGLELGADDYVTKPFSPRELVARTKALLRRDEKSKLRNAEVITVGTMTIDIDKRSVMVGSEEKDLTATEFDLLAFLARSPGRAFSREHLLTAVWGYTSGAYEHTVNTHINRLRNKLETDPANPEFIQTVWGVGYRCTSP